MGPFPSVGLTLTWFIWDRNLALHITFYSVNSVLYIVLFYLDQAKALSRIVRNDVIASGFTLSEEKSNWDPRQEVSFLGYILNFESGMIYVSESRLDKLRTSFAKRTLDDCIRIRSLASIVGQIISMGTAVGNIVRLMTRHCYAAIENRSCWDQIVSISPGVREELSFWSTNLNSLNGKPKSPKSTTVGIVYSDSSDSGFGGYLVQCGRENVSGSWSVE